MPEIKFFYKGKKHIIQYEKFTNVKTAFEEFVNNNSLKINELIFCYNGIKINLNTNLSIEQQFDFENIIKILGNKEPMLEILVFNITPVQNELNQSSKDEEEEVFLRLKSLEINFVYKNTSNLIKCSTKSSFKKICEQFSDSNFLEMKYLIFIYDGTQIDIKEEVSIIKQLQIEVKDVKKYKKIEIFVFEEFYQVIFSSCKINIPPLIVKETILIKDIIKQFEENTKLKKENYTFVYSTKVLKENSKEDSDEQNPDEQDPDDNNWDKSMIDILSNTDKDEKVMTIMVYENNDDASVISRTNTLLNPEEVIPFEDIIKVKFLYQPQNIVIEAKKDDKLKELFQIFTKKAKLSENNLTNILFLYGRKRKQYSIDTIKETTLINIASKADISKKEVIFIPTKKISEEPTLFDNNLNEDNDLNELLLVKGNDFDKEYSFHKNFYLKIFFILAIQYFFIILVSSFFLITKISREITMKNSATPFIVLFIIFLLSAFFINKISNNNKNSKHLICFIILYPVPIIYFCLEISTVLQYKYIIIGLSLIFLEKLSQGIYVTFFKKYELLFFGISSSTLSLIGLIFFSAFWIKELLPIIYISIFYLCTIGINLLLIFISLKICEFHEYYYSLMIFNYGIFLAFENVLKRLFFYMKKNYEESEEEKPLIKIFLILIIQYIMITFILWIVLSAFNSKGFTIEQMGFHLFFWPPTFATFIIFIISIFYIKDEAKSCKGFILCHVLYVPIMVLYYYSFSFVILGKYILCFIFIIFIDLLTIIILFLVFKKGIFMFVGCFITNTIAILFFHFLWLKNTTAIIVIPILSFCTINYLGLLSYFALEKFKDNFHISFLLFEYGLFFVGFTIAGGAIGSVCFICYCCCKSVAEH